MSALYDKAREKFLTGSLSWTAATVKAVIVDDEDYTVDLATDEFLVSIPAGARVATSTALTNKTATAGVAGADNVQLNNVTGDRVEAVVLYDDTGDENTSALIAYIDSGTGLPVSPNGGSIIIEWSTGPNKIFKL